MSDKPKKRFDWHRRQYYLDFSDHIELIFSGTVEYIDGLETENAKLRKACGELLRMAESNDPDWLHWPEMHDQLRELGVEVDG